MAEKKFSVELEAKNLADQAFRDFIRANKDAERVLRELQTPADEYAAKIAKLDNALKNGALTQEQYARAAARAKGALAQATPDPSAEQAFRKFAQAQRDAAQAQRDAARVISEIRTPAQRYEQQLLRLNKLLQQGALTQEQYNRAVRNANDAYRQAAAGASVATKSIIERLGKLFAAAGTIESVFKVGTAAVNMFKGDLDGMVEALKQLPFGIGAGVQALQSFILEVSGVGDEIERINAQMKDMQREAALSGKAIGQQLDLRERMAQMRAEMETAGMASGDARVAALYEQQRRELAALERMREEARREYGSAGAGSMLRGVERELNETEQMIRQRTTRLAQQMRIEEQAARREAHAQEVAERKAREQKLRDEIIAAELKARGLVYEAERRAVRRTYEERLAQAKSVAERELLLRKQQIDEAAAYEREKQRRQAALKQAQEQAVGAAQKLASGGYRGVASEETTSRYIGAGSIYESWTSQTEQEHIRLAQRTAAAAEKNARFAEQLVRVIEERANRIGEPAGIPLGDF